MQILNAGEYTGEVIQKVKVGHSIITNTLYSTKTNNPAWHYHENLHICFVFQGGKAETRHQTRYTDRGGSIFFYHAEERHRWISPQPVSKSANIEIEIAFLQKYHLSEASIKEAIYAKVDAKSLILKMQNELRINDAGSAASVQSLLLELISKPEAKRFKTPPLWLGQITDLLQEEWNEEISLSALAKIVHVHPVTISKYFRKYLGCTLGEYRRKLKIEKSIDLIKNSNKSLTEIAFDCSFADQSHFTRTFKERTGFLPKDFRRL